MRNGCGLSRFRRTGQWMCVHTHTHPCLMKYVCVHTHWGATSYHDLRPCMHTHPRLACGHELCCSLSSGGRATKRDGSDCKSNGQMRLGRRGDFHPDLNFDDFIASIGCRWRKHFPLPRARLWEREGSCERAKTMCAERGRGCR